MYVYQYMIGNTKVSSLNFNLILEYVTRDIESLTNLDESFINIAIKAIKVPEEEEN